MNNSANILIVDDSNSMREILILILSRAGYAVTEACNGKEAITKANDGNFDLVITDLYMPEMDGFALTEQLRQMSHYRTTPILSLTTAWTDAHKEQGRKVGMTGWLVKPFIQDKLLATLSRLLN